MVSYHSEKLPNGLRLVHAHMPHWRSVAVGVFAGAGSRHESLARHGIAHFTEHMLFKGTPSRRPKQIVHDAESAGGSINAYTSEEHTCYHIKSPATHFRRMVNLLSDIYQNSLFPDQEIARERHVIEDEILMYRDEPASHVDDVFSAAVWRGHPLERPILGTPQSLARFIHADFQAYVANAYSGANTVVATAGPQEMAEVLDRVSGAFGSLPKGRRLRARPFQRPTVTNQDTALVDRETEQVQLRIGFHIDGRRSDQIYPTRLLSVILGETMSSRLSQELREKRGYCYHVSSSRDLFIDTGLLSIQAAFEPRHLRHVVSLLGKELRKLRDKPPSKKELKSAYEFLAGHHLMGLEETSTQMFWMGDCAISRDDDFTPDSYLDQLRTLTQDDLQRTAQEIFVPERLTMALLGPHLEGNVEDLKPLINTHEH